MELLCTCLCSRLVCAVWCDVFGAQSATGPWASVLAMFVLGQVESYSLEHRWIIARMMLSVVLKSVAVCMTPRQRSHMHKC